MPVILGYGIASCMHDDRTMHAQPSPERREEMMVEYEARVAMPPQDLNADGVAFKESFYEPIQQWRSATPEDDSL